MNVFDVQVMQIFGKNLLAQWKEYILVVKHLHFDHSACGSSLFMPFEEDCPFTAFGKEVMAEEEAAAMAEAERVDMESFPPPTQPTPSDDEDEKEKEEEKEDEKEKNEEKEEEPEGKKVPKSKAKAKPKAKATMKRPSSSVVAKRPASSTKKAKTRDEAEPEEPAEPDETEEPVEEEDKKKKKEDNSEKKADQVSKKDKEKKDKEKKEKEKQEKDAEKAAAKAKAEKYEGYREAQRKAKAKAKGKAKMTAPQRDEERADKEAEEEKEEKGEGEEEVEELSDPKKAWYFNKVQAQLPQEIRALWESKDISRADKTQLVNASVEKKGFHYSLVLDNPVISALTETYQSVWAKSALLIFYVFFKFWFLELFLKIHLIWYVMFPICFCIFLFPLFHTIQERCRNAQSFNAGKVGQLWRCFDPSLARWRRLYGSRERSWFLRFQDFGGDSKQWCQINH